jgi:flagellar biosynthesis/type III secretory pathway chaperone
MENQKLSQEELQQLKDYQQKTNQIVVNLGQLEIQKSSLLKTLDQLQQERIELGKVLQENYGDGNINLESGEITPLEEVS